MDFDKFRVRIGFEPRTNQIDIGGDLDLDPDVMISYPEFAFSATYLL